MDAFTASGHSSWRAACVAARAEGGKLPGKRDASRGRLSGLAVVAGLLCSAQTTAQAPPDAGRIQEQLRIPEPRRPAPAPDIRIQAPRDDGKVDSAPFLVERFRISGATAFTQDELLRILGEPRQSLTLAQVQAIVDRLTTHYREHGYIVARAFIPAQDVRGGVVDVAVLEGRYGRIDISNASEISEARLRSMLGDVTEFALVHGPTLERAVLLISDMAGVEPKATLEPGEKTGLTNLILEVAPARDYEFDVTVDNFGSRFTGRNRVSAGMAVNSPFGMGDRATARAVTSDDRLFAIRLAYEAPLGASGLKGSTYLSHANYQLGAEFAALQQSGTATATGANLVYPLVRSAAFNFRLLTGIEGRDLEDDIGALAVMNKKTLGLVQWGASGDFRDQLLSGAVTGFQVLATQGRLNLRTPSLEQADALTARSEGRYAKVAFNANRVQALSAAWRVSLAYTGQRASGNLDSSEKFSVGGPAGVRAYPVGEAAGDDAHVLQAEVRYHLGSFGGGQLVPLLFGDWARSRINHELWPGFIGTNERRLSGYGAGAEWSAGGAVFVRASHARKRGDEPATADVDRKSRTWLQMGVLF
jgi:hemolysin activation/secretion protein